VAVYPPSLFPGAPVAVVAPASPPRDRDRYRAGVAALRATYDVRATWTPGHERGYLSAPDAVRAQALHDALTAPSIRAVVCVRGGYGCLRLLDRLDWAALGPRPTLLVGYSDITALHLALYARHGWIGLSGPVVTEWPVADEATLGPFRRLAAGERMVLGETLSVRRSGTAEGPLLGGNLSVLSRLVGTPYAPDFRGAILCLEDVAEAPYRVDRMLAHLRHAGVLGQVAGVVLGHFTTDDAPDGPSLTMDEVFADYFGDRPYPVVSGLAYGHQLPRQTLPIGTPVRLVASAPDARLEMTRPAVSDRR